MAGRVEYSWHRDLRMHACDFPCIRVHATGGFARLDVRPNHGTHVALIVHEASIEVGSVVRVRGYDVGAAPRERIFQEVEHAEEFAGRKKHMVTKEAWAER